MVEKPDRQSDRTPSHLRGLSEIADDYDALLVDLWGCLHDGITGIPSAVACLRRFRKQGGRVVLLSNAPRLRDAVEWQLNSFGVPADAWDSIMTAGMAVRYEIEQARSPWYMALGRTYYVIGAKRDCGLLDGLDKVRVASVSDADFVLCCGIRNKDETIADFRGELERALELNLPMVSSNPDRYVLRGNQRNLCAGSIAERYVSMGGNVKQEGKPYPVVYDRCRESLANIPDNRILALGDGIETDISGAHAQGLDSVWITGGLPAYSWGMPPDVPPPGSLVQECCEAHGVQPRGFMPLLAW